MVGIPPFTGNSCEVLKMRLDIAEDGNIIKKIWFFRAFSLGKVDFNDFTKTEIELIL